MLLQTETYNNVSTDSPRHFNSNGYMLTVSQAVFDWKAWQTYSQVEIQVKQAAIIFAQAQQNFNYQHHNCLL